MKFIVDAQLPKRLARWLTARGHDALHTLDLPEQNQTQDAEITALACREHRIVVTKDSDFVDSFLLQRRPPKLLLIATGNLGNQELEDLLARNINAIEIALGSSDFIELSRDHLIFHGE